MTHPTVSSTTSSAVIDDSPFHAGEREIQGRLGVREQMEKFGKKVIRDFMPEQHRDFYSQLPFLILGHCDKDGWPWASIVAAPQGFISSPDDKHLNIDIEPITGDPLATSLTPDLPVGVLGIEPRTRRRNRLSTRVSQTEANHFQLNVKQSFGNCPQYIQSRHIETFDPALLTQQASIPFTDLSTDAIELIRQSDTFYVASSTGSTGSSTESSHNDYASYGADASHRGGKPGFVAVNDKGELTIPDYLGNNHFNTLGNFQVYPKAGLLFIDDKNHDILMLTGTAEILWDDDMQAHFEGAQRFWRFKVDHGVWLKNSLAMNMTFDSYSANTELTGNWQSAQRMQEADAIKTQWQACRLTRRVIENDTISSFYFKPTNSAIPFFEAGQFITLQVLINDEPVVRTYTVSNASGSDEYRISVKRDDAGLASSYLHDKLQPNQRVLVRAPQGEFTFDTTSQRPAVMLAAGIGITPILAMLHSALIDGVKRRHMRPIYVIATARTKAERAFSEELNEIAKQSNGLIHIIWGLTSPEKNLTRGEDFHYQGRISAPLLQQILPLDDYDFYVCGPDGFMQHAYDIVRQLGVNDRRIMAESFGPSSLLRQHDSESSNANAQNTEAFRKDNQQVAKQAVVTFNNKSGEILTEQPWSDNDGSLLEFAESHGINPDYGCRSGNCGTCIATLKQGGIAYAQTTSAAVSEKEILLCCAKPAYDENDDTPTINIQLSQ